MKRNKSTYIWTAVVILAILAVIGLYIYEVVWLKKPFTENLFRAVMIVCLLLGTLARLIRGGRRQSLEIYEKAYEKELRYAFRDRPMQRKKLLCACRLYNESNYRKALKYLYQLLKEAKIERDAVPVLLFIALCYTDAGVPGEAIEVYYELLKMDRRNAQAHSNLANLLLGEGDYENALKHINLSIEYQPDNYYAYMNKANYYFKIHDYDQSAEASRQALVYKNNGMEAASLLTIIYALQGDEENRKKYYHISITSGRHPEDLDAAIDYYLNEVNQKEAAAFEE